MTAPPMLDEAFQRYVKRGDREALGSLLEAARPWIYRIAYRVVRDQGLAEDACQEVALILSRSRPGADPVLSPRAWLAKIAFREALRLARRRGLEQGALQHRAPQEASMSEPIEVAGTEETRRRIWEEVNRLPESLRIPLTLRYWEDLSYQEIAQVMDCPEGTLASRLHEARERLKRTLVTAGLLLTAAQFEEALGDAEPVPAPPSSPGPVPAPPPVMASPALFASRGRVGILGVALLGTVAVLYGVNRQTPKPASPAPAPVVATPEAGTASLTGPSSPQERPVTPRAVESSRPLGRGPSVGGHVAASGRVLDLQGRGVGQASVELVLAPSVTCSAQTDSEGMYAFPGVPLWADLQPEDPYAVLTRVESATLRAKGPGGGEADMQVALPSDGRERLEFSALTLIPPSTLTVILTDAANRPVVGAPIAVMPLESVLAELPRGGMSMFYEGAEIMFHPETLPRIDAAVGEFLKKGKGITRVYTDADGTARLGPFKPSVLLLHGPFPTRGVRFDPRLPGTLRLSLARARVECLVVDAQGNPLPGVEVYLNPHRSWPKAEQDAFYNRNLAAPSTRTDQNGVFRYEGLPDGKRFQLSIRDASGKGGTLIVEDFDPSAPPARICFAPARLQIRFEGTLPSSVQTIRAHAVGIQANGKREILYLRRRGQEPWERNPTLAPDFCNPPYSSLKLWFYAEGCRPVEGRELGAMAAGEQGDLVVQLLPGLAMDPPTAEELLRQAKAIQDALLPGLLANDWSILDGGALDEAFLRQVWPQGELPPDLAHAGSAAGRNVRYVQGVLQQGVGAQGLAEFKAEAGAPIDFARWGSLERFRFDLVFTRQGSRAGFGVYVYRLGNQVRYDVYGVYAPQGGDRP